MFACLFGFFLPFLDDERLYMRLGEESLSNVLRNVKLGRSPLGRLVLYLPAIFIEM